MLMLIQAAFAGGISVNFRGTGGRTVTEKAGAAALEHWNNVAGPGGSVIDLLNDAGKRTGADVKWSAIDSWYSGTEEGEETGPNSDLMDGYIVGGPEEYTHGVTFSDIPYESYDVHVYVGAEEMGASGSVRINGGGTRFFYRTWGLLPEFEKFQTVGARVSDQPQNGNHVVFRNVVGGTVVIEQATHGDGPPSGIMGAQIVDAGKPKPRVTLDRSVYRSNQPIPAHFEFGPGEERNNLVLVKRGASPKNDALYRVFVGGAAMPTSGKSEGTVTFMSTDRRFIGWYDVYLLADDADGKVLAGPETIQVLPPEPIRVSVGAGSYASAPPAHEGSEALQEAFLREFFLTENAADRPIPTNEWWTDLVINRYAGDMWALPFVVSADAAGVNVFQPRGWSGNGTMRKGSALRIRGETAPELPESFLAIADFETRAFPDGWTVYGEAFGSAPATDRRTGQGAVRGFLHKRFVNSFHDGAGEESTGKLVSPDFRIQRDHIHFLIGGGNHAGKTAVNLIVGGTVVRTATGANRDTLSWKSWNVAEFKGKAARVEIVDDTKEKWGHVLVDQIFQCDEADLSGVRFESAFAPKDARAHDWGDWTVTMRMAQNNEKRIDVTFGHGLPFVWVEARNVTPVLPVGDGATFFDSSGAQVEMPTIVDRIGIEYGGRLWGIHLPRDSQLSLDEGDLRIEYAPVPRDYLVVTPLLKPGDLELLDRFAHAIPRDSKYAYRYEPRDARVYTSWSLETEALKGTNLDLIQGWIPHHYRETINNLSFLDGLGYETPRGLLRCSPGRRFDIWWSFNGLLPHLPAPQATGKAHDYQPSRMAQELAKFEGIEGTSPEVAPAGRELVRVAKHMLMAKSVGDASASTHRDLLRTALSDWFNYTPGEKSQYFAWFENYPGLVAFDVSSETHQFNDHHLHYGYHLMALAMLGLQESAYLDGYGKLATLIAKDFANWDRSDERFPYLRTFDIWAGRSLASGFSSPSGNEQDSSSEALQSWAALLFLGDAMGNSDMAATGAMGYAVESQAALEYWIDLHDDVFPSAYRRGIVGTLFDSGNAYATFFSSDPGWIYGVQWRPVHPTVLSHLTRDPDVARKKWERMRADRRAAEGTDDIASMDANLANVVLGYSLMVDPDWTAEELDRLWSIGSPVVTEAPASGLNYYYTHALRSLGELQRDYHMSIPMGMVYFNAETDTTTYIAWNPRATWQHVTVYREGVPVGCLDVPAHSMASVNVLDECAAGEMPAH